MDNDSTRLLGSVLPSTMTTMVRKFFA